MKKAVERILKDGARVTGRKVQNQCDLDHVSRRTIQRKLSAMDLVYAEARSKIVLSKDHMKRRLELASEWLATGMDWSRVIFTDEKRFNSDGPDSWRSWMRKEQAIVRNRRQGGPSIQVRGTLIPGTCLPFSSCHRGATQLVLCNLLRTRSCPSSDLSLEVTLSSNRIGRPPTPRITPWRASRSSASNCYHGWLSHRISILLRTVGP